MKEKKKIRKWFGLKCNHEFRLLGAHTRTYCDTGRSQAIIMWTCKYCSKCKYHKKTHYTEKLAELYIKQYIKQYNDNKNIQR